MGISGATSLFASSGLAAAAYNCLIALQGIGANDVVSWGHTLQAAAGLYSRSISVGRLLLLHYLLCCLQNYIWRGVPR